jgi:hypothetical protein
VWGATGRDAGIRDAAGMDDAAGVPLAERRPSDALGDESGIVMPILVELGMNKRAPSKPWTEADDGCLRLRYLVDSYGSIAADLGRTPSAVRNRCARLGLRKAAVSYSDDERRIVAEWYRNRRGHKVEIAALAKMLGRPTIAVNRLAREMGLTDKAANQRDAAGRYPCKRPRFESDAERRAHQSERQRRRIAEHGHPRGMAGKTHTPEAKAGMAEDLAKWRESVGAGGRSEVARKAVATRVERYGTGGPTFLISENPYSRAKRGYIDDIPGIHFRSLWEANYARYLDWLREQGQIESWAYEPDTFVFHGVTRAPVTYTPDFRVTELDGSVVYHEVKGWMDGKSKSKLKRMAKFYPAVRIIVVDESGYRAIAKWAAAIPHWGDEPAERAKR